MRESEFARLLELCDIYRECEQLPAGWFRLWARENARRAIDELLAAAVREVTNGDTGAAPRE